MLSLPDPKASAFAIGQPEEKGYTGQITASVRFEDEVVDLKAAGIDAGYVIYDEAGVGFVDHACRHIDDCRFDREFLTV